jgi:hypothetical protein
VKDDLIKLQVGIVIGKANATAITPNNFPTVG